MRKFIIAKEYKGYTILKYLKEIEGYSGRSIRNLHIFLNNKRVKPSKKIRPLNRLMVKEVEKGTNIKPVKMDLKILFEDGDLLLINKEPHIITHPTLKKTDRTLAHGVVHYFEETLGKTMVPRFFNRLDMDTSGIIVVTKNAFSQAFLQEKVQTRKYYKAIVVGLVKEDEFLIETPIGRVGENIKREILAVKDGGQVAKTKVKVLKRYEEKGLTLVECELFTGRTHQIRVHLSSIGHFILGDTLYGQEDSRAIRQLLHSYKFEFVNPNTKKVQVVEAPLPEDMEKVLK